MDLFDVVRSCFRRWYVVLPLVLVSAWVAHSTYTNVSRVYYSSAVVGLAPPNSQIAYATAGASVPRNGLLEGGGPIFIANLALLGLHDPSVVGAVVAAGGSPSYSARMFQASVNAPQLPLIFIEATENDPILASKTVEAVVKQTDSVLMGVQQQAGVPDDLMVRALPTSAPGSAVPVMPSRTRSAVAILAAGIGLSVLAGVVVDWLLLRRSGRRKKVVQSLDQNSADQGGMRVTFPDGLVADDQAPADSR